MESVVVSRWVNYRYSWTRPSGLSDIHLLVWAIFIVAGAEFVDTGEHTLPLGSSNCDDRGWWYR